MDVAETERIEAPAGGLAKAPTGVAGLDEISGGGLPAGRPTLVCGGAGCGKTLLATGFLVHGATRCGEPGVLVAFEESAEELAQNVRSLGYDLDDLVRRGLLVLDSVRIERGDIEETGEYDLEGLFIRLGYAIDSIGARRVVLDTIEALFSGLQNEAVLRSELRRLFRWLKERGVTAVITAERGEGTFTRYGLEEYVSDCVILLDQRVTGQITTRRLRIVKYRGSAHGSNEYPFLIDQDGVEVMPITAAGLAHTVSRERVSTGVAELDAMLGGGYYRGSSVLVSGTAGSGKSSLAAHFAVATCRAGERCAYFTFEESRDQMVRNLSSIGLDLATPLADGTLTIHAARPTLQGLEAHLAAVHRAVRLARPRAVVIDPIGTFVTTNSEQEVRNLLVRLIDFLKELQITAFLTSLTPAGLTLETTDAGISSLIDTWVLLRDSESRGRRSRRLCVLKSRGMKHSHEVRELLLTDHGIELRGGRRGKGAAVGRQAASAAAPSRQGKPPIRRPAAPGGHGELRGIESGHRGQGGQGLGARRDRRGHPA